MYKISEARAAIEALLCSANDPAISESQARNLINEAIRNASFAFGRFSWDELVKLASKQSDQNHLLDLLLLEWEAMFENSQSHDVTR